MYNISHIVLYFKSYLRSDKSRLFDTGRECRIDVIERRLPRAFERFQPVRAEVVAQERMPVGNAAVVLYIIDNRQ